MAKEKNKHIEKIKNIKEFDKFKKGASDFKTFISRGNVIDMAVGVVVGSAFSKIVTSLVNDIIMPLVGMISGRVDFSKLKFVLSLPGNNGHEVAIMYGNFIQ